MTPAVGGRGEGDVGVWHLERDVRIPPCMLCLVRTGLFHVEGTNLFASDKSRLCLRFILNCLQFMSWFWLGKVNWLMN